MIDWTQRSRELERIDSPESIPPERMAVVLRELRLVNRWLGGTRACLRTLAPVLRELAGRRPDRTLQVADWGAGSGDLPAALAAWARRHGIPLRVLALDFNLEACRCARRLLSAVPGVEVAAADVFRPPFRRGSVDVVLFSAFLHHFSEEEIARLLEGFRAGGVAWAVINDLQRSRLAYWGIRLLTGVLSNSPEIRHDGPLSVRKGFRRAEWDRLARRCSVSDCDVRWLWAFRWGVRMRLDETNSISNV